jgi:hypothetical protein
LVGHGGCHNASLCLGATAAESSTEAEAGPFADNAVNGAVVGIASHIFGENGASEATMGSRDDDGASVVDGAAATSLGAARPATPGGDLTVNSARVRVAGHSLLKRGARDAAIGHGGAHSAGLHLRTATAEGGAHTKARPVSDHAVDGAAVGVAVGAFREGRACATTSIGTDDGTGLGDLAAATRDGTLRPGTPRGDDTVEWAGVSAAGSSVMKGRASDAIKLHRGGDGAVATHGAAVAEGSTDTVLTPLGDDAVDGALVGVTVKHFRRHRAADTAVHGSSDDAANPGGNTRVTGGSAIRPGTPFADDTGCRAVVRVARLGRGGSVARGATVRGLSEDGPVSVLCTAAAGLGAGAPLIPVA